MEQLEEPPRVEASPMNASAQRSTQVQPSQRSSAVFASSSSDNLAASTSTDSLSGSQRLSVPSSPATAVEPKGSKANYDNLVLCFLLLLLDFFKPN